MKKTIVLDPFLVEIKLTGEIEDRMWRLVFAPDKNGAWEKTRDYLENVYLTTDTKYHITVHPALL